MRRHLLLGRVYPLVDDSRVSPRCFATAIRALVRAGATTVQLRAKRTEDRATWAALVDAVSTPPPAPFTLIVDDRADLCLLAAQQAHPDVTVGLHVGQVDLAPLAARRVIGAAAPLGLSTHDLEQVRAAQDQPVDYIGFGPVFATRTKARPDPEVGLRGLRDAVARSKLPVVAIGGIGAGTIHDVLAAGAAAAAVVSALDVEADLSTTEGVGALEVRLRALLARGAHG